MKYTLNHKEAQLVAGVKLEHGNGEITDAQAKAIAKDPWGSKLIASGKLVFEKAIEIPTKPKLGMSVAGAIKGTNGEKKPVAASVPAAEKKQGK